VILMRLTLSRGKKMAALFAFLLVCGVPAAAQLNVRGQIFLPNGSQPSNPIRFFLSGEDGSVNDYRFTDSNGRFILERLSGRSAYTITITGDGVNYGDTIYQLRPEYDTTPRITLNPPPRKKTPQGMTVSVGSSYKPDPKAAALYEKAMKAVESKQLDLAEPLLRQATEADPKYAAAWNALGALLMQLKKYADAEKPLRQALELDPKYITALLNLGIDLNHLGKYAEAVAPLREALRLQPDIMAAHEHLGIALVETDQFPEAEQELKKALRAPDPDEIVLQLYLGKLYARTGEFQKSIDAFTLYLEKAPGAGNAAEVRALIERMKRQLASRP
jgi:tetratricopeptide (TPR) repeat protein